MPAVIQRNEADKYAGLLRQERIRHARAETEILRVNAAQRAQIKLLNKQLEDAQSAYIASIATNMKRSNQ